METVVKKRIWYWDILRISAMIFLVIRHSATATFEFVETLGIDWWVSNVYGSLSAWMVPVFLMISGASFLDPNRNITIDRLYKKNIFRMLCAFAFWAIFYACYNKLSGQDVVDSFVTMVFQGHFHLWFIPMIIGMYMVTPLLRVVTKSIKVTITLTIVTAITGVIVPLLQDLGLFFDTSLLTRQNNFGFTSAYICFFLVGYVIHNVELSNNTKKIIYAVGILSTLVVFIGTYLLTLRDGQHNEDMQADNNLFTALQGIALFVFAKDNLSNVTFSQEHQKLILDISGLTFGVYMIHVVLLALLDKLGFSPVTYPAIYMIPMLILFVLPVSFFLSWLVKKIPIVGKYIV
jgi:surface polysaccharide O-acyltransferase-like enzyme